MVPSLTDLEAPAHTPPFKAGQSIELHRVHAENYQLKQPTTLATGDGEAPPEARRKSPQPLGLRL
eukprot:CAMPEP_0115543668 /NCGR_PEP_ID=MMETSP0271-20121206/91680_1 /TAXON_ID=71861 /ORGANISM="Scrippsiella trochoidea, Strain CCMP3099" /LENGTH=64 /DNA_ID=CAMNT_0002976937 /DNA_START=30 /DNA_END=221 /DNA_ORIENTATION=-